MLMTMQVRFDPMTLGPKQVLDAVVAVGVAEPTASSWSTAPSPR